MPLSSGSGDALKGERQTGDPLKEINNSMKM
jgi:hypothetical protein